MAARVHGVDLVRVRVSAARPFDPSTKFRVVPRHSRDDKLKLFVSTGIHSLETEEMVQAALQVPSSVHSAQGVVFCARESVEPG